MIPPTFLFATPESHHDDDDDQQAEKRGLLGWILPASIALHVLVVILLPQSRSLERVVPPSIVVEMQEPPPPPPKPKPVETTESKPLMPAPPRDVRAAANPQPAPLNTSNNNAPLDFSSMTFSNDGPGLAIGASAPAAPPAPTATTKPSATAPTVTAAAAPFVPLASLKRAPRAPGGLDAELERNYPVEARRSGISGQAILRVQLDPDGRVGRVDVVSESYAGFGNACSRTVRSARWEPPLDRDGHAVSTEIKYVCRFEVGS